MHTIRLRHPWQCEINGESTVWSRKFNWPAEPTPGEIVRLVIEPISASATVSLNGTLLGIDSSGLFDITASVAKHNLLTIEAPADSPMDSTKCPFDVRLEIVDG